MRTLWPAYALRSTSASLHAPLPEPVRVGYPATSVHSPPPIWICSRPLSEELNAYHCAQRNFGLLTAGGTVMDGLVMRPEVLSV